MIACSACGAPVGDLDAFCADCGAPLGPDERALTPDEVRRQARPFLVAGAVVVVGAILFTSVALRGPGQVAPFADPAGQRDAVARFHELVVARRWEDVHALVAEPFTADASAFADFMRDQEQKAGRTVEIQLQGLRLRRSRSVPVLSSEELVTLDGGRELEVVSTFVWHDDRWLFAFTAAR